MDPSSPQSHMNMDSSNLNAAECDDEMKGLQNLLDVFGSICSLKEIAEAYCKAGRDVYKAGDILYQSQERNPNSSLYEGYDVVSKDGDNLCHSQESNPNSSLLECTDEVGSAQSEVSFSVDNHRSGKGSKTRTIGASMGTVSGVLGKTYARHTSKKETVNDSSGTTKPLKIHVNKSLMDQLETETVASDSTSRKESLHGKDMEEFLFSMLVGFELSMDDIREVLGQCGYDAKKSMDRLLVLSAKNLEDKTKDSDDNVPGNPQKDSRLIEEDRLSNSQGTSRESSKLGQDRSRLSREVLEALFTAPERSEEEPKRKRPELGSNRRRGVGRTVVSGPPDTVASTPLSELLNPREVDIIDDEDEYQGLRRTVKLHWDAMKTYYEGAVESFAKGDRVQADYLMEQGHFYGKMAREVDEKTTGYYNRTTVKEDGEPTVEIKETRKSVIQADVTLDLHLHTAREAVRMLKFHISSLASIPSFKYLKVIVDSDGEEDATKGKRRRLVNKLLERESITWIEEEENPGTIFIQLDLIDPAELSFTNPLE